jgi:hypothetical protein
MSALTITPAAIIPVAGYGWGEGIAGATIAAGQPLYRDASDSNKIKLCDANASLAAAACVGVSLHASLAGQPIKYIRTGDLAFGAILTKGGQYIVGASVAGDINPDADLTTGWYRTNLFWALSTSVGRMNLLATGITP